MDFDARAAKLLTAGQHFTITDCPGLRFEASATRRSWIYRYKSPVDGKMRQTKLGEWPAMSPAAAELKWEQLRASRDGGVDLALQKQADRAQERAAAIAEVERQRAATLTVRRVCEDYLVEFIEQRRKPKGAAEVRRMFDTMLGPAADLPAATMTRSQAHEVLRAHIGIPVQCAKLRTELGAAWDYSLDAGRLPESAPNWWRLIMRGQLRSKGRKLQGKSVGTKKRVLSDAELRVVIPWLPNFSRLVEEVCTLYLWTCTRGAEILAIEAHELSEEDDGLWWNCPKSKTKNSWREEAIDLRVPLIGRAEVIIRRRLELVGTGYLFPSSKGSKLPWIQQKTIGCAVWMHMPYSETRPAYDRPRLPVTHWAPHDLRRTGRTQLAALGCPDEVAEAVIGHMPAGEIATYNLHAYDKERRLWLTRLADRLETLVAV